MEERKRNGRDPYYLWKILNMILAGVVLILAVLVIAGELGGVMVPLTFFLGAGMCALTGIMELAKNKRFTGYVCSVFSGILIVALIFSIIQMR